MASLLSWVSRPGTTAIWDDGTPVWDDSIPGPAPVWDIPGLQAHVSRNVSGAVYDVAIATTEANATVAIASRFIALRSVVLAVSEANAVVALQSNNTGPPDRPVQLAVTEASAVAAFTVTHSVTGLHVTFSATVDMLGPMTGAANADDAFNAGLNIVEANAIADFQAHSTDPRTRNVVFSAQGSDATAVLTAEFIQHFFVRFETLEEDAVAAFTASPINPQFAARFNTIGSDAIAAFTGHSSLFGVFDSVLTTAAEDAVASFTTTNSTPAFNVLLQANEGSEANAVVRLFMQNPVQGGTWPGFSDLKGLIVRGRRHELMVEAELENPPA